MSVISPVQSHDQEGSPVGKEEEVGKEGGKGLLIRCFEPGVKK